MTQLLRKTSTVVALLGTALSLGWVLYGLDWLEVRGVFSQVSVGLVGSIVLLLSIDLAARSARHSLLLNAPLPYKRHLSMVAIGFLATNVVPLRMGELVRPYLLKDRAQIPAPVGVAAMVSERLFDLCAMAIVLALTSFFVTLPPSGLTLNGVDALSAAQNAIGTLLCVGLLGGVGLIVVGESALKTLVSLVEPLSSTRAAQLNGVGAQFIDALSILSKHPLRVLAVIALTATQWLCNLGVIWLGLLSFPGLPHAPTAALAVFCGALTGVVLFPTPGYFGPYEAGFAGALILLGANAAQAKSVAILMHLIIFSIQAANGLLFTSLEGWSFIQLVRGSLHKEP